MYKMIGKRIFDFIFSLIMLIVLSPIFIILTLCGTFYMKGNPFFTQIRPGKNEKLFKMIKFRTMSNEKDKFGNLLPDEKRLNSYGKFLRSTSLDEIPELINILIGEMSLIGPRPLLVRDMVFMSQDQRKRHKVRPGLSGLAQVNGRNTIDWEKKLNLDLIYLENITLLNDFKIILKTIEKVFKREDINRDGTVSDMDFGDYLLLNGKIQKKEYKEKMIEAKEIVERG
ncbi:sugar transferase [Enterococcus cecorum]|uniref:sugar transferase n=1 Tax=Enterococcus cecorum TaxID=44008 RepID=UPI000B323F74|nr:sugar transferase [Enterococcus cecorum]CAI3507376.1 sugar transferase [Enterococcus cecorum]